LGAALAALNHLEDSSMVRRLQDNLGHHLENITDNP
jgi:hypothetical protein